MNLNFYPSFTHLMHEYSKIGASQCGILEGLIVPEVYREGEPYLKSMVAKMPDYQKIVLEDPSKNMQYHLAGYGSYNEEALVKLIGEGIERYAAIVSSKIVQDKIIYATYKEVSKQGKALPVEYLNVYSVEQQEKISRMMPQFSSKWATEDDVMGWIRCPSLMHPGEDVFTPAQLLFVGYKPNNKVGEKLFSPSFSTGTASYTNREKALANALIEYVQIDAFIIRWYTGMKSRRVVIDDETVLSILDKCGYGKESQYEIIPLDYTLPDIKVPVFGVFVKRKNKKIPYIAFGTQGDLDPANGLMRGVMEASAVFSMSYNNVMRRPESFATNTNYSDLDSNVLYYANNNDSEIKDKIISSFCDGQENLSEIESKSNLSAASQVRYIVEQLRGISEYAVYMDFTPPEIADMGWNVMRVVIPEICGMCLPGFPFKNHVRFKKYGGVINDIPHPLP